ncbi:hypothetical protein AB0L70_23650 [Kribbella sp. NPDC051952]
MPNYGNKDKGKATDKGKTEKGSGSKAKDDKPVLYPTSHRPKGQGQSR